MTPTSELASSFSSSTTRLLLLHPFNGLFSRTTWVSWYQKGKNSLDLNMTVASANNKCKQICKQSAPCARQTTMPTHHSVLQAACSSWCLTVSKHWRYSHHHQTPDGKCSGCNQAVISQLKSQHKKTLCSAITNADNVALPAVCRAAIDRHLPPAGLGPTDTIPYHRPCSANYAGSAKNWFTSQDLAESPCIKCIYLGTQLPCCGPCFTSIHQMWDHICLGK